MQDTNISPSQRLVSPWLKKSKELLDIYDKNEDIDVSQSIELLNELNKNIQECLSLLDED